MKYNWVVVHHLLSGWTGHLWQTSHPKKGPETRRFNSLFFRKDAGNPPSRQSLGCFLPGWCEVVLGYFQAILLGSSATNRNKQRVIRVLALKKTKKKLLRKSIRHCLTLRYHRSFSQVTRLDVKIFHPKVFPTAWEACLVFRSIWQLLRQNWPSLFLGSFFVTLSVASSPRGFGCI